LSTLPENGNEFCRIFSKKKLQLGVFSIFFCEKSIKKQPLPGLSAAHCSPMEEADIF